MFRSKLLVLAVALTALLTFGASADEWVAMKLRGGVFAFVDGGWTQLQRGDVVPDDRVIRTQPSGRVTFVRGTESIDLGPSTQIQIFDRAGKHFTTVRQYYGEVAVEADVENVQHFGVRTPYLAAVVKGTKFIVTSDDDSSAVEVTRGKVAVENFVTHQSVLLTAGQSIDTDSFVTRGADGLPIGGGVGLPGTALADLGGYDPNLLQTLLGEDPGVDLDLGGGDGVGLMLDLGGGSGVNLAVGGSSGLVDLGAGVGGVSVNAGVGTSGSVVDLSVGLGATGLGVTAGGGGVSVSTPPGGLSTPLGGLL